MFHGWKTRSLYELEVHHLGVSRMNERHQNKEKAKLIGKSLYQRGYPFEFVFAKFLGYLLRFKFNYSIKFIIGNFIAWHNKEKQYANKDEKRFIRKVQYIRLADIITQKEHL